MSEQSKTELLVEINNLKNLLEQKQEILYENNIEERPTIMKKIIDRENQTLDLINYSISQCEKETGRNFPYYLKYQLYQQINPFKGSIE